MKWHKQSKKDFLKVPKNLVDSNDLCFYSIEFKMMGLLLLLTFCQESYSPLLIYNKRIRLSNVSPKFFVALCVEGNEGET